MGNKIIMGNYNQGMTDGVKCGRCETLFDIRAGFVLTECNHIFCKKCFNYLFQHNPLGFFKCLNAETDKMSRCQKLVARTAVKEIYNIEDYISHTIVSVPYEEKISEDIPSIQNEPSTNIQHDSFQNEQSTNDEATTGNEASTSNKYYFSIGQNEQSTSDAHVSTCGNEASTSNKYYFSTSQNEQSTNDKLDSTRSKEESTSNKYYFSTGQNDQLTNNERDSTEESTSHRYYVSTGQIEQSTNDKRDSTWGKEESTSNKYYFSTGQNDQSNNDERDSTCGNEESTSHKYYFSTGQNEQSTNDEGDSIRGKEESICDKYYVSTGQNEQSTNDECDSTRGKEESICDKYYVPTGQNENTKNKEPSFISEKQEPETSRSNAADDQVLKYKEHEEPMSHEPNNYQDATQCRNPECKVWLFYGEEQYSKKFFTCPDCKQRNCFLCKGLHNPAAINCAEYKKTLKNTTEHSEDFLKKMLENNEAMLCPTCKETLLKDDGCDFITCFWCKVELCWATRGYRWGAWGPGDTSGGCRCGVDGIKCHPHCRGCH